MRSKFRPMRARFRATFSGAQLGEGALGEVDAENEVLRDVQIVLEGEAKGHGVWLDREFVESVAAAGNATGDVGLKVRYGHPAMCADAIGTELARARDFRVVEVERDVDGEKVSAAAVVADIHMLKSAHSAPQGDIVAHVMATAAEDPRQFGQSIVFTYADWVVKDADGNRHSYRAEVEGVGDDGEELPPEVPRKSAKEWLEQSADGRRYAVLGRLHGTDFTDEPAATDGIFSTGTLAEEAERMLDEHPQIMEVLETSPQSVVEFLERTGLDKRLESARVAGLQAAKDREIAELRAEIASAREEHEAALAAKDREIAELMHLETDIAERSAALDAAKAEVEQLTAKVGEAEKALAETRAALEAETERYREQVGAALAHPEARRGEGLSLVRCSFPGAN